MPEGTKPADSADLVVLDTSALLYWTLAPERLSTRAADSIATSSTIELLSVCLWEISLKHHRGALELPIDMHSYYKRLLTVERLRIRSLDAELAIAGALLDWDHHDPADRWITCLAMQRQAPLVSSDRTIGAFYARTVW